jgi:two-component system sensor histidine kinase RegB
MTKNDVTLPWLLRLRWAAITGQTATIIFCVDALKIRLPLLPLVCVIATTLASQLLLLGLSLRLHFAGRKFVGGLLVIDTLLLTALLYFSGGPDNPFSAFYLIHIAMAASLLGAGWTWGLLGLSLACFGGLFLRSVPLIYGGSNGPVCGMMPMPLHLIGMFFALALTGICLAWFVARLNTQLREQTAALHAAEINAERERRFASLVTLAAGVAHEINSPLATITVAARELEREAELAGLPQDLTQDAKLIRTEVERCREILGRLYARAGEGSNDPPTDCRADELVNGLRASLLPSQLNRLQFVSANSESHFRIPRNTLLQALTNLITNAVDASPPNSPVRLEFTSRKDTLVFTVSDEGQGLPPDVVARLGEPFVTTKEPGKGTGLGLFLVRRFAEQMGGRFEITSVPGTGTRAILEIPQEAYL